MIRAAWWTLEAPDPARWDFGDSTYGLEPLALPRPAEPWSASSESWDDLRSTWAAVTRAVPPIAPVAEAELESLYWFRWVVGHQVSFIMWRLMADVQAEHRAGALGSDEAGADLALLVQTYGAMLSYAGSCPVDTYTAVIRPSLQRLHPAFSGTWAPDYGPVRSLLAGRDALCTSGPQALVDAVDEARRLHLAVAARLVPDGPSLLQQVVRSAGGSARPSRWFSIFDCAFLTVRTPLAKGDLLRQLLRRSQAVLADLRANHLDVGGLVKSNPLDGSAAGEERRICQVLEESTTWAMQTGPGTNGKVSS